jgi:DNA invertase Pin-like site-specific DNA recombinase
MVVKVREKAVLYYRRSTTKQEESIERQRDDALRWAADHGFEVVREESDDGITGSRLDRAGWQRAKSALLAGEAKHLIFWRLDRWSRWKPEVLIRELSDLAEAGVTLWSVTEGRIPTEGFEWIVTVMRAVSAHEYLPALSRSVSAGMLRRIKAGLHFGPVSYGYRSVGRDAERKIVPDPATMKWVRQVFEWYARHEWSVRRVAQELNRLKVPTPGGVALWSMETVRRMLRNEAYIGTFLWNKESQSDYFLITGDQIGPRPKGTGKRHRNGRDDCTVIPNHHEALIDQATWDLVQRRLAERRQLKTPHAGAPFALTGRVFCGACPRTEGGETKYRPMYATYRYPHTKSHCPDPKCKGKKVIDHRPRRLTEEQRKAKGLTPEAAEAAAWESYTTPCPKCGKGIPVEPGAPKVVYLCAGATQHGRTVCRVRTVHEADLIHVVSRLIEEEVLKGGRKEWRRRVEERLRQTAQADPAELTRLRKQLGKLDRDIATAAKRFLTARASLTAILGEQIEAMRGEREALADRLATLEQASAQAKDIPAVADAVVKAFEKLQVVLLGADPAERAAVLRRVVERVTVHWDDKHEVSKFTVKLCPDAFSVRNLVSELTRVVR